MVRLQESIATFIRTQAYSPLTGAELAEAMQIPEVELPTFVATLQKMEAEGLVVLTRRGRYGAPERMNLAVGKLQGHVRGFAFLLPDTAGQPDVFVGKENLGGALHGDRVMVRLSPGPRAGSRIEGDVVRILARANERIVGTYEGTAAAGHVSPDDQRLPIDILVPKGQAAGAKPGEKVVVRITRYPDDRRGAEGRVVERLGQVGDPGVDILSIIRRHQLPEAFAAKVLKEADGIPGEVMEKDLAGRRDLRGQMIVTIDGEDAKDLDDAVSLERLAPDVWRLGVHIADVTHYVREGTGLDREALRRGTSVYLADRVVPMLPPKLSNNICSLNPLVDRLTLTCQMDIDERGQVKEYEIYPSVIRSTARMTYTAVHGILQGNAELRRRYAAQVAMLEEMAALMAILRERRMARGALDFDLPEAKLILNDQGIPTEVRRQERTPANQLIEEFMLMANETVARHCFKHRLPTVYRIHDEPAPEKMAILAEFVKLFGYTRLRPSKRITPKALQEVVAWAETRPEATLLNMVLLRSLKQAQYNPLNQGHFGLAASHYLHFTSPIRRYPDLFVHRALRESWTSQGRLSPKRRTRLEALAEEAATLSSERERAAVEAERDTYDLKKAQFMQDKVGNVFSGIISGVTAFGFFVALPNTIEGLVHVSTLADDYYHYQQNAYALVGERTRRTYRLGDRVTVRLERVSLHDHQLDFEVAADGARAEAGPKAAPTPVAPIAPTAPAPAAPAAPAARNPGAPAAVAPGAPTLSPAATASEESDSPPRPVSGPDRSGVGKVTDERGGRARSEDSRQAPRRGAGKRVEDSLRQVTQRLDMWGIPVRASSPRRDDDEDPKAGATMFAMTQSRGDRRRRSTEPAKAEAQKAATPPARSAAAPATSGAAPATSAAPGSVRGDNPGAGATGARRRSRRKTGPRDRREPPKT